jgi:hypothetical protein
MDSILRYIHAYIFHLFLIFVEGMFQQGAKKIIRTKMAGSDKESVDN